MSKKSNDKPKHDKNSSHSLSLGSLELHIASGAFNPFDLVGTASGDTSPSSSVLLENLSQLSIHPESSKLTQKISLLSKLLFKKDNVTRVKAFKSLYDLAISFENGNDSTSSLEGTPSEFWDYLSPLLASVYGRTSEDPSHTMRELSQRLLLAMIKHDKKMLSSCIKEIAGPWLSSMFDTDASVAHLAKQAFQTVFSTREKKINLFKWIQPELEAYLSLVLEPGFLRSFSTSDPNSDQYMIYARRIHTRYALLAFLKESAQAWPSSELVSPELAFPELVSVDILHAYFDLTWMQTCMNLGSVEIRKSIYFSAISFLTTYKEAQEEYLLAYILSKETSASLTKEASAYIIALSSTMTDIWTRSSATNQTFTTLFWLWLEKRCLHLLMDYLVFLPSIVASFPDPMIRDKGFRERLLTLLFNFATETIPSRNQLIVAQALTQCWDLIYRRTLDKEMFHFYIRTIQELTLQGKHVHLSTGTFLEKILEAYTEWSSAEPLEEQDSFLDLCHTLLTNSRHVPQPWFHLLLNSVVSLAARLPDSLLVTHFIDTLLQAWSRFERPPVSALVRLLPEASNRVTKEMIRDFILHSLPWSGETESVASLLTLYCQHQSLQIDDFLDDCHFYDTFSPAALVRLLNAVDQKRLHLAPENIQTLLISPFTLSQEFNANDYTIFLERWLATVPLPAHRLTHCLLTLLKTVLSDAPIEDRPWQLLMIYFKYGQALFIESDTLVSLLLLVAESVQQDETRFEACQSLLGKVDFSKRSIQAISEVVLDFFSRSLSSVTMDPFVSATRSFFCLQYLMQAQRETRLELLTLMFETYRSHAFVALHVRYLQHPSPALLTAWMVQFDHVHHDSFLFQPDTGTVVESSPSYFFLSSLLALLVYDQPWQGLLSMPSIAQLVLYLEAFHVYLKTDTFSTGAHEMVQLLGCALSSFWSELQTMLSSGPVSDGQSWHICTLERSELVNDGLAPAESILYDMLYACLTGSPLTRFHPKLADKLYRTLLSSKRSIMVEFSNLDSLESLFQCCCNTLDFVSPDAMFQRALFYFGKWSHLATMVVDTVPESSLVRIQASLLSMTRSNDTPRSIFALLGLFNALLEHVVVSTQAKSQTLHFISAFVTTCVHYHQDAKILYSMAIEMTRALSIVASRITADDKPELELIRTTFSELLRLVVKLHLSDPLRQRLPAHYSIVLLAYAKPCISVLQTVPDDTSLSLELSMMDMLDACVSQPLPFYSDCIQWLICIDSELARSRAARFMDALVSRLGDSPSQHDWYLIGSLQMAMIRKWQPEKDDLKQQFDAQLFLSCIVDQLEMKHPDSAPLNSVLGCVFAWKIVLQCRARFDGHLHVVDKICTLFKEKGFQKIDSLMMLYPKLFATQGKTSFDLTPFLAWEWSRCALQNFDFVHLEESLRILWLNIFHDLMHYFPSIVSLWWKSCTHRQLSIEIQKLTGSYFTTDLIAKEISKITRADPATLTPMRTRTLRSSHETSVHASIPIEESTLEIQVYFSINYPLEPLRVEGSSRLGITESVWRKWLFSTQSLLTSQNGSLLDGLLLWKRNSLKRFEGVEECAICYSILQPVDLSLPTQTCRTCRHKFHSACIFKWFKSSGNSTCPLCRSLL